MYSYALPSEAGTLFHAIPLPGILSGGEREKKKATEKSPALNWRAGRSDFPGVVEPVKETAVTLAVGWAFRRARPWGCLPRSRVL